MDILATLLADTYTLIQLKQKVRVLKNYLTHTYFGGGMDLKEAESVDLMWLKSLNHAFYQNFTKDNINQIFTDLEAHINKLPTLTVKLPFEPDSSTTAAIGAHSRKLFDPTILLDIKYDPSLIAGAGLVWKGIYKDYSLKAQVEAKKEEILGSFKKFLR